MVTRGFRELTITVSFAAWAQRVLENRILARIDRNRTDQERRASADVESEIACEEDVDLQVSLAECLKRIARVNREYVRALNYHCQGYETDEICARMQLKRNTLYSLLHRGRVLLKRCLDTGELQ